MAAAASSSSSTTQQQPVLLLDVMDTLVTDPFFEHMPRFFNMSFKELLAAKHPTGREEACRCSCHTHRLWPANLHAPDSSCTTSLQHCSCSHLLLPCVLTAAWVEFENDVINQDQLFEKFFADGRQFDGQALVQHMVRTDALSSGPCAFLLASRRIVCRLCLTLCRLTTTGTLTASLSCCDASRLQAMTYMP